MEILWFALRWSGKLGMRSSRRWRQSSGAYTVHFAEHKASSLLTLHCIEFCNSSPLHRSTQDRWDQLCVELEAAEEAKVSVSLRILTAYCKSVALADWSRSWSRDHTLNIFFLVRSLRIADLFHVAKKLYPLWLFYLPYEPTDLIH